MQELNPIRRWQHGAGVHVVACSPDGATVLSGGDDARVCLWREGSDEPALVLVGHENPVFAGAYSPDGGVIVTSSQFCNGEADISIWQAETGEFLYGFAPFPGLSPDLRFSPDGRRVITGNIWKDKVVRVWDLQNAIVIRELAGHSHYPHCLAYSPDGKAVISGSAWGESGQYSVRFWEVATGRELHQIEFLHPVRAIALSPEGSRLIVASGRGSSGNFVLDLFSAEDGSRLFSFAGPIDHIEALAFLPGGDEFLSSSSDGRILRWGVASQTVVATYPGHQGRVESLAVLPTGDRFVSGAEDGAVFVWPLG